MSVLFSTFTINNVTLRNRIIIPPMCQYSAVDGMASDWHMVHYGSLAAGGAAAVILEATAVEPEGRISPYDLGIWNDSQAEKLKDIFAFISSQGALPGIQLAHAGRKASTDRPWTGGKPVDSGNNGWSPIYAPSAAAFTDGHQTPSELTREQIKDLVEKFRQSAIRAQNAGARIIEIHAAHGYLLHEFLSPLSNKRPDEYGGSPENRMRFLNEVMTAVRPVINETNLLFVRLSATDWAEGGYTPEEAVETAKMLKNAGADFIDCSTGGLVPNAKIPAAPGFQVPFASKIKNEAEIPVSAVGIITQAHQAETILKKQQADIVMIGRASLRNHQWAIDAARELGDDAPIPLQYARAY
ncbi:MAG: NADH:flavin oxidoreductase/NADH oxidase [Deferribacterales bacterium]